MKSYKETWSEQMDTLRTQAADRRKALNSKPKKEHKECAPNRKAKAKLAIRKKDYSDMIGRSDFKAPMGAYHCPGSMKVYG